MTALKGADAKEIASSVTAIANEKIKAEKEANASKKKGNDVPNFVYMIIATSNGWAYDFSLAGAKKKQIHVDKADDEAVVNAYDGYDDYDFM